MCKNNYYLLISFFIATVWFVNGLFLKVLNLVPRHQEIIANIISREYSKTLTILIGFSEVLIAIWIITGWKSRLNTIAQIIVIAAMNILEFFLASNLLLWGKFNIIFATIFILLIIYNEFVLLKKISKH